MTIAKVLKPITGSALVLLILVMASCSSSDTQASGTTKPIDQSYAQYGRVLHNYVKSDGVDYAGLQQNRAALDSVVEMIASADLSAATAAESLAFFINSYNALTLRSIIDAYPVKSIKDIDDVWKKQWRVAGGKLSINDIENKVLRKEFNDPRIHMAINCASKSCPPLRPEPYVADSLDQQLHDAAVNFVSNDQYNQLFTETARAELSQVFNWFGSDFVDRYYDPRKNFKLSPEKNAVLMFVIEHHPKPEQTMLLLDSYQVTFRDYDWSLNDASHESGNE